MSESPSDLRFLAEPRSSEHGADAGGPYREIALPRGLSAFDASDPAALRVDALRDASASGVVLFETLTSGGREALLMHTPAGVSARVNGSPAPRLCVLGIRDQLHAGEALLHLTRFRRIEAGPVPHDLVGRICGVCRLAVKPRARVVVHDCGAPLHLEPESVPEADRLECALVGCPTCRQPVEFEAGFVYEPEPRS